MKRIAIIVMLVCMLSGMAFAQTSGDTVQSATPSVKELQEENKQLKQEIDQLKKTIDQLLLQKQQLQESRQQILSVCGRIFKALLSYESSNQQIKMSDLLDDIKETLRQILINN